MAKLYLIRHGKSEWNTLGKWTGLTDVSLNEEGVAEAKQAAEALRGTDIHRVYTSALKRAQQTFEQIRESIGLAVEPIIHPALNERHYGIYTGKNKWQVKEEMGAEEFQKLRRAWDFPIPEGESLKQVFERVLPYYQSEILPRLLAGEHVLIVAHGNSLRALAKHLEGISDEKISELEIGTGEVHCYTIGETGLCIEKTVLAVNPNKLSV